MAKVYAMIANGTEEVECLAVVDLLRRSGVETELVSVEESCEVTSSHKVRITARISTVSPPIPRWHRRTSPTEM